MFKSTIYIGRVFGIPIRMHLSWLIIFVLITWSFTVQLQGQYEGWNPILYWLMAAATALLFFGSVLFHELAHSLLARARGLHVKDIILFIFGGVSEISEESKTPIGEFLVAIIGPASSVVLGVAFMALSAVVRTVSVPIGGTLWYLGVVNIVLAVFNMIPGFPLDGGRVLRAILWKLSGNMESATRWAARTGQAVAYFFIFAGIWLFFGVKGGGFQGLWLVFIGWFLDNAALSSYRQVQLRHALAGHAVGEVMMRDYPTVHPDLSIGEVVNLFMTYSLRAFPVMVEGGLVGLITVTDINKVPHDEWTTMTVGDAMVNADKLVTASQGTDLWEALITMTNENVNQLPVVEGGSLEGLITRAGVLTFLRTRAELGM